MVWYDTIQWVLWSLEIVTLIWKGKDDQDTYEDGVALRRTCQERNDTYAIEHFKRRSSEILITSTVSTLSCVLF